MGGVRVLLGGRGKEITHLATGSVKESRMKTVADLWGLPDSHAVWAEGVNP